MIWIQRITYWMPLPPFSILSVFDVEVKMSCYKLNWNTITVPKAVTHTIALSLWLIWHELIAFGFVTRSR